MEFKSLWGCQISRFKSLCRKSSRILKAFARNPAGEAGDNNKIPAPECIEIPKRKIFPPCSGSSKDPTNRYIKNSQTHNKLSLQQKGSGTGRKFNRNYSKSNTLPIQIYLTIVETSGGTTSVGLWSRSVPERYGSNRTF